MRSRRARGRNNVQVLGGSEAPGEDDRVVVGGAEPGQVGDLAAGDPRRLSQDVPGKAQGGVLRLERQGAPSWGGGGRSRGEDAPQQRRFSCSQHAALGSRDPHRMALQRQATMPGLPGRQETLQVQQQWAPGSRDLMVLRGPPPEAGLPARPKPATRGTRGQDRTHLRNGEASGSCAKIIGDQTSQSFVTKGTHTPSVTMEVRGPNAFPLDGLRTAAEAQPTWTQLRTRPQLGWSGCWQAPGELPPAGGHVQGQE